MGLDVRGSNTISDVFVGSVLWTHYIDFSICSESWTFSSLNTRYV